jgi:hypothetical protein
MVQTPGGIKFTLACQFWSLFFTQEINIKEREINIKEVTVRFRESIERTCNGYLLIVV